MMPERARGPLALDDGFAYFAAMVPQRDLGATLSDLFSMNTTRQETPSLCRMPLPE
jgi:hypothetical protein